MEYLGLDERDPRVCISLNKDHRFAIKIGPRMVLEAFDKNTLVTAFMLPFDIDEKDELIKQSEQQNFWFNNSPGETLETPHRQLLNDVVGCSCGCFFKYLKLGFWAAV